MLKTQPFDPADYLDSEEGIAAYLADARTDGAAAYADAIEVVARARDRMRLAALLEHKRNMPASVRVYASALRGASGMSGKREHIEPKGDDRYIRRDDKGRIKESDDVGRSLSQDVKKPAKTTVKPGYGDKGDQKKR